MKHILRFLTLTLILVMLCVALYLLGIYYPTAWVWASSALVVGAFLWMAWGVTV